MAIDTGLAIGCADLQATGGISQILLRSWTSSDVISYSDPAHSIDSILDSTNPANWFVAKDLDAAEYDIAKVK